LSTQRPTRELSIEQTLTWAFNIYLNNILVFAVPFLIAGLASAAFSELTGLYTRNLPPLDYGAPPEEMLQWLSTYFPTWLAMTLLSALVSWILSAIASGVCTKTASNKIERGIVNLGDAFSFTVSKLISLLITAVITGILIMLGLVALIIPGIILIIMFSLTTPSIIIENLGALDGISRSRRLVSHRWLKTFALLLLIGLSVLVLAVIVYLMITPIATYQPFVGNVVQTAILAFIEPIIPISITIYYYSMLAKEEQERTPPPPPPF